jgi:1-phosphatidylinositol-3-phosphate 5-kinase
LSYEEDEDELAGQMLVQFPSYGTQSQALNKDSSSQWQEKTADWLLGGTSSIPTPKQQQLQKEQQHQQQQQQENHGGNTTNSNINSNSQLQTVEKENSTCFNSEETSNGNILPPGDETMYDATPATTATTAPKVVNPREWSVDEQLLWKSPRFPASENASSSNTTTTSESEPWGKGNTNNYNTFTTRNGEVLTLKEHDVVFEQPVLEDPSRDFLAAYYYHVGVMPKSPTMDNGDSRKFEYLDATTVEQRTGSGGNDSSNTMENENCGIPGDVVSKQHEQQLRGLIKQHSSPYHVNNDIRKDLAFFEGIAALPGVSEEKDYCCDDDECLSLQRHCDPNNSRNTIINNDIPSEPPKSRSMEQWRSNNANSNNAAAMDETNDVTSIAEVAWMPDRLCKTCYSCDTPFTVFRRRHHCRICGQVFCNTCSGYFVPASSSNSASPSSSPSMVASAAAVAMGTGKPTRGNTANTTTMMHYSSQPISPVGGIDTGNGSSSTITLRTCKMCYDQVTARQQKQQKKLKTAEEAAAASVSASESADRKRKQGINGSSINDNITNNNNNSSSNSSSSGVDAATPKRGTTITAVATATGTTSATLSSSSLPSAAKSSPQMDHFSSRLRDFQINSADIGFEESSAYLRQWSKAIGAEGITSLATKAAGLVRDEPPTSDGGGAPPQDLSAKQRQTSHSSSTSSAGDPDRSGIVEEGNRHLGETAASHLEQMTASLLESDAPLLWGTVDEEQSAIAEVTATTAEGGTPTSGISNNDNDIEKIRTQWINKLMSLATRCCATVDTNVKRGDMLDIRPYVKIKGRIIF